jgi:hypothetical protein
MPIICAIMVRAQAFRCVARSLGNLATTAIFSLAACDRRALNRCLAKRDAYRLKPPSACDRRALNRLRWPLVRYSGLAAIPLSGWIVCLAGVERARKCGCKPSVCRVYASVSAQMY